MSRHLSTRNISSKSMHAFLSNLLLTDRQTDKRIRAKTFTSSFVGGKKNRTVSLYVAHIFMPASGEARLGGGVMFSSCPSVRSTVRPFVCYRTCAHNVLKTNEATLMQLGTSSPRGKAMKLSTSAGIGRSKFKVVQGPS